MKFVNVFATRAAQALLLLLALAAPAFSQNLKPVATISISSVGEVLGDLKAVCQIGGAPEFGDLISGMGGIYTNGIDKTRPIGAYLMMEGMEPRLLVFVPVKDLKSLLNMYREQIGEPRDVGDGIYQVAADKPQPIYFKEQQGWAFLARSSAHLGTLPADPTTALGGMHQKYDLAIRLDMQNIPPDLKQLAMAQLQKGFDQGLQQQQNADPEVAELAKTSLKSLTRLINELDQLTIGYAIKGQDDKTYVDAAITFLPGSELAAQMAKLQELKSSFAGFLMANGAARLNFVTLSMPEDIKQLVAMVTTSRQKAMKEIDNDPRLPDAATREKVKNALGLLFDVAQKTIEAGKMDGGAVVSLENQKLSAAVGGFVADAKKIEEALKQFADVGRNHPEFPKDLQFNVGTHGGIAIHTFSLPLKIADPEAKKIFGESISVAIGTGTDSAFVAVGDQASELLKKVIDKSAADKEKLVDQTRLEISLAKILKFVASMQDDPKIRMMADSLANADGKDHIILTTRATERGVTSRIELEAGVLKLIGTSAKAAQAGGGF